MKKIDVQKMKNNAGSILNSTKEIVEKAGTTALKTSTAIKNKAVDKLDVSKEQLTKAIDQNGDGQITIEDVIIMGLKVPGVKISREEFLKKEFSRYYDTKVVNEIIKHNPSHENISLERIDKIADDVIQYERICVSGISTALGVPGGLALAATLPTDIAQYYGYMLRAIQKLLYLYGFPDIELEEEQMLDSATLNTIIICMGVMYGVASANIALKSLAKALGTGVEKKLLQKALTKGTIYPIVKQVAKWFNVRMTKEIFAGFFKKSIPVVGGVVGGGITYLSFKPCCEKLKETLHDTKLSNPNIVMDAELIEL